MCHEIKIPYANHMASKISGILQMAELKIPSGNPQLCTVSLYQSDEIRSEEPFGPINPLAPEFSFKF
jgi:hypothetical protein